MGHASNSTANSLEYVVSRKRECDESMKRANPSPNKTRDRLGLSAIAPSASGFFTILELDAESPDIDLANMMVRCNVDVCL